MLLKLRKTNVTPPDKYRYTIPEDGTQYLAFDFEGLMSQVERHYVRNEYPVADNLRSVVEDANCQRLSGEWCEYEDGNEYVGGVSDRFTIEDVVNGTSVLASFTLDGANTVSKEEAEQRALTCARCYMNQPVPGCAACYQLLNVIARVTGNKGTSQDQHLKSCLICHCSNKAQVWIPAEHLEKGLTQKQAEQFSRVPHCWKAAALNLHNP